MDSSGPNTGFPSRDLALLWRIPFSQESDPVKIVNALQERIKELNCLYGVSQLAERHLHSLDDLLTELVRYLPYSWQFPEITCARILLKGKIYTSERFKITEWRQSAQIYMYHEIVGEAAIFYREECPPSDEGPFMKEERALLDAVAEQIGTIATRITAESELQESNRQLMLERKALQESNTALRIIMSRIEQEKQEIRQNIAMNIERIIIPILNALLPQLSSTQKKYIELLQTNLQDIASPFISQLSLSFHSLTPTEIAISNMIRAGMTTKEIAEFRHISEATVNHHREKIRHKLKLTNRDINLVTFLQANMNENTVIDKQMA